jgi:fructokinase
VIVVGGEALIDLVLGIDGSVSAKLGGGPFNVARTIGRLGGTVSFLGAVSNDSFGTRLFQQLVDDGVDTTASVRTERPTTLAAAEIDQHGAATYRFYLEGTSAPALDRVPPHLTAPDAVHIGTLGLVLQPMASTLLDYVDHLPVQTLVMLDPNCRERVVDDRDAYLADLARAYRRSHVVKISTDDASYLSPGSAPIDYAREVVRDGARVVLLTAGGDGTWVLTPTEETLVPTTPIVVVDTIGAGDAFGGGFLAWWMGNGLGIDDLAAHDLVVAGTEAAQQVAAFTCQRAGADPPRLDELPPQWGEAWTAR